MDEPQPLSGEPAPAAPVPAREPDSSPGAPPPGPPERRAFWGYSDFLLFVALAAPSMLLGWGIVKGFIRLFGIHVTVPVAELIPEQFIGYTIWFGLLAVNLRLQYGKPFWSSLGWVPSGVPLVWQVAAGIVAAFAVAFASALLRTPNAPNPMTELMRERTAMILMAVFGTTAGPLCEELAFRGFLQPLLVRTFGAVAGVLLAALPFGLLHFQ
jgi:membrane protease YdiL (CAAX protease family)